MNDQRAQTIILQVERRDHAGAEPYMARYEIPYRTGMTHMDALRYISDEIDTSLAFYEHSCKRGFCGACLIRVDDKKLLSCRSLVAAEGEQTIRPALKVDKDYWPLID